MGRKQDDYESGYVLYKNQRFVSAIFSNGDPENPVVYYTPYLADALAFRRDKPATARAKQIGAMLMSFRTEAPKPGHRPKRYITGRMEF